jgi:phosphoribosylformylglycinamidine cyclo-ligase
MVDGLEVIDGSKMKPGDAVIGLASSGLHSNGYSLVRKVFIDRKAYDMGTVFPDLGQPLGDMLLTPTAIYVKPVLETHKTVPISGMAHITGGGFQGNIPRVVPGSCSVRIRKGSWEIPAIFNMLRRDAGLDDDEMFRTFNMGIGMVLTVPAEHASRAQEILSSHGTTPQIIGEVEARPVSGEAIVLD